MTNLPPQPWRVLVIDDDPVLREVLSLLLPMEGHAVTTAESGEAALEVFRRGTDADVVLADVQLPGLTGPALAKLLRIASPDALLVAMSGSEPDTAVRRAFDAFLLKPFTAEDFNIAVLRAGDASASEPEVAASDAAPAQVSPLDNATYDRLARTLQPAQLADLYKLTLDDAHSRICRLSEVYSVGDEDTWRREAHALKGGCSMVGAVELASLAARAETVAFADTPHPGDFAAAAERLRSNLTARFSGIT